MAALTLGITTARAPECKRGVAVNLGAAAARAGVFGDVCVVDGDPLSLDVTTRLPVRSPLLEDYASATAPAEPTWLHSPSMGVLASAGGSLGTIRRAADRAHPVLSSVFDVVVWDLVGGPTGPGQVVGGRLDPLDWLLLAVTPHEAALAPARHFVEHFDTARARGAVSDRTRFAVVTTGDEGAGGLGVDQVADAVGAPVVGRVPQLWGRAQPNLGFGAALAIPELDDEVCALLARLGSPTPVAA